MDGDRLIVEDVMHSIRGLTMKQLILLNEQIRKEFGGWEPDIGVREPLQPVGPVDEAAAALDLPSE